MEFLESAHATILTLHVSAVFFTLGVVVSTDLYALQWVIGWKEALSPKILRRAHRTVWVGLIVTMSAGFLLFLPYDAFLLSDFAFRLKMLFVAMLVVNALVIGSHIDEATKGPFAALTPRKKLVLITSGLVSTGGWIGAFIAAQFIGL